MSEPTGEQSSSSSSSGRGRGAAAAAAPAPPQRLELVVFEHHDRILGGSHRALGVVVDVDDQGATVRPLAAHDVRVALEDVQRYEDTGGDVDPTS